MNLVIEIVAAVIFAGAAGFQILFTVTCLREGERRAAAISGVLAALFIGTGAAFVLGGHALPAAARHCIPAAFVAASILVGALFLLPLGRNPDAERGTASYFADDAAPERFDKRRSIFSRGRGGQDPDERERFYAENPDLKDEDEALLARLEGASRDGRSFDGKNVTIKRMSLAAYGPLPSVGELSNPEPAEDIVDITPEDLTAKVKAFALHAGAGDVGICEVRPWYFYERGDGAEELSGVARGHSRVVVMAFEMDKAMVDAAPHLPIILETRTRYAQGSIVSVQIACFLASMGYSATANHFGNYEMLMVPPAVDAGLGELGRNGYLVSRRFGMRSRLAAVTTTAPLVCDSPVDMGVQEFCRVCLKCARTCPSRSIPDGDRTTVRGVRKWQLDDRTCYEFWHKVGTDCGICMRNCPYSHPQYLVHRLGALAAGNSGLARRALAWADDFLYGAKPRPRVGADWLDWRKP